MKIAIICSDFKKSNIRKFPWKYIYEIARYLDEKNEVVIITDTETDIDELRVNRVNQIFKIGKGETEELIKVLNEEAPDKCIMLLGLSSFIRKEFNINFPVYGVLTSPPYTVRELIKNIGFKDSLKYRRYTAIHYLNAIIPNFLVKKWSQKFEKIIFLSEYTRQGIIEKGCPTEKCVFIPIGIEKHFLDDPDILAVDKLRKDINPKNLPIIMYFTSPLTLRGTDTLVKAFAKVKLERECKLIFLSRVDYSELKSEEKNLKKIAERAGVSDSIKIISNYLNPNEIKEYLSIADIICLPFKIVISDVPVSILEAQSVGKHVISTNVACIPEILDKELVEPNDPKKLANAIVKLFNVAENENSHGNENKKYKDRYYDWREIGNKFTIVINN